MADYFLNLAKSDQREALEFAREKSGRPAHLLEKDIWVVWALDALFSSQLTNDLTFKGGTSLSKVFKIINRFSEDIDLTFDIRKLIPDLMVNSGELPASRSQANKWTKAVRSRLPLWITSVVVPILEQALKKAHLRAEIELGGKENDKLFLHFPPLTKGTGYVAPVITLEFGGRASGEPHQRHRVSCDIAEHLPTLSFPVASPQVMNVSRTFWEKATAAHVFCAQGRIRSERYARHWYDLVSIASNPDSENVINDRKTAMAVAQHKSFFFSEKDAEGKAIDYEAAACGGLKIVPTGAAKNALETDYAAMLADQIMIGHTIPFEALLNACATIESRTNQKLL